MESLCRRIFTGSKARYETPRQEDDAVYKGPVAAKATAQLSQIERFDRDCRLEIYYPYGRRSALSRPYLLCRPVARKYHIKGWRKENSLSLQYGSLFSKISPGCQLRRVLRRLSDDKKSEVKALCQGDIAKWAGITKRCSASVTNCCPWR